MAGRYSVLMRSVPETGWQYYVATPIAGMIGGASRALLLFGVTAVIAILLVAAVTHMLMRRQIVEPVREPGRHRAQPSPRGDAACPHQDRPRRRYRRSGPRLQRDGGPDHRRA